MKIKDIIDLLNTKLMLNNQEKWDNSGLQIGNVNNELKGIIVSLDLTKDSIEKCVETESNLIITHHPFIFTKLNTIDLNTYEGKMINEIIKNNITVYSMHTTLDLAFDGVNESLASALNISKEENLIEISESNGKKVGYGGVGYTVPVNIVSFAKKVKDSLMCPQVRLYNQDNNMLVKRVAFCGGSGADFIDNAIEKNADVYITGDIKYHDAQYAIRHKLAIIDAGHYYTEYVVLGKIKSVINEKFTDVNIAICNKNTYEPVII